MKTAMKQAQNAADEAFDSYLDRANATATAYVPQAVLDAANKAYTDAGGKKKIEVCGRGNLSHPVCSVFVREAKK